MGRRSYIGTGPGRIIDERQATTHKATPGILYFDPATTTARLHIGLYPDSAANELLPVCDLTNLSGTDLHFPF